MSREITAVYAFQDLSDAFYAAGGYWDGPRRTHDWGAVTDYALAGRSEYFFAFNFYYEGFNYGRTLFGWRNALSTAYLGGIRTNSDGSLSYVAGNDVLSGAATATSTATGLMVNGGTYTVEIRIKLDDSVGVCQVKVNGVMVLDFAGDTKPTTDTTINFAGCMGAYNSTNKTYWVVMNNTDGSEDNTWPGLLKFATALPNADGSATGWTASAGNRYTCVNENPQNGDSNYISSSSNGQRSSFAFAAHGLPANASIKAYINRLTMRKDTAGQVTPFLRISSANYDASSALDLGVSYKSYHHRVTKNPATTNPWQLTDAPELGVLSGGM